MLVKSLPIQLLIGMVAAFFLGKRLDMGYISMAYTASSCMIEVLLFCLPLVIFTFIAKALINIKRDSLPLIATVFVGVTCSNIIALFTSYSLGRVLLPYLDVTHSFDISDKFNSNITALFGLGLPNWMGMEKAMLLGVSLGLFFSFVSDDNRVKTATKAFICKLSDLVSMFLSKLFMPLLPIYVFGFCMKLSYDDVLIQLFQGYGKIFLLSMSLVAIYICTLYWIGSDFNIRTAIAKMRIMLPAGIMGFGTMSSAATMPLTISCTERATNDRDFTNAIIPTTANIHMLGDDLTITLTAMTLLLVFGLPLPSLLEFIPFAFAFSIAKLSCVGIPGASVFVIFPVLVKYMGFSPEMISVLTTIYILQDPLGTCANVMGNGAFALITHRVLGKTMRKSRAA